MKNKKLNLFLAINWFVFTTILLCIPGQQLPKIGWLHLIPQFDKIVHISIFGILSFLFCKTSNTKWFWLIAFLCSVYGIAMEFVQKYYIPNRSFDVWDIVADMVGSFGAMVLMNYCTKMKRVNR